MMIVEVGEDDVGEMFSTRGASEGELTAESGHCDGLLWKMEMAEEVVSGMDCKGFCGC